MKGIKYTATMPADTASDVASREFNFQVDGGEPTAINVPDNGGSVEFAVPEHAAFGYWATMTDATGNKSQMGAMGRVEDATDETPPPSPDAPTLGKGDSVELPDNP